MSTDSLGIMVANESRSDMSVVTVVGNPKTQSRTRHAAHLVAQRLTGAPPEV